MKASIVKNKIELMNEDATNDILNAVKKFVGDLEKTIESHRATAPDSYDLRLITNDLKFLIIDFKHAIKI